MNHLLFSPELNGRPFDCTSCPFATSEPQGSYVTCGLHGGRALSDAPTCTDPQWHARALKELNELVDG